MIGFIHFYGGHFGDLMCKLLNGSENVDEQFKVEFQEKVIENTTNGFYPTHLFDVEHPKIQKHFYLDLSTDLLDYASNRFQKVNYLSWQRIYSLLPRQYQQIIDSTNTKEQATMMSYVAMIKKNTMVKECKEKNWIPIKLGNMSFNSIWKELESHSLTNREVALEIYKNWLKKEKAMFPNILYFVDNGVDLN